MHRLSFLYMQSRGRCVACLFSPVTRLRTANTVSYRGCGILGKNLSSFIIKVVYW